MPKRQTVVGLLIAATATMVALGIDPIVALSGSPARPMSLVELKSYDWRMSLTADAETARQDIVLVQIDEDSLRALQPEFGRWPWPRVVHGDVIEFLARGPARLIGYGVIFAEPDSRVGFRRGDGLISGSESDRALNEVIREAGSVFLLLDAAFETSTVGRPLPESSRVALDVDHLLERRAVFPPMEPLASSALGLGHGLIARDDDGPLRHHVPLVRYGEYVVPSLPLAMAGRLLNVDLRSLTVGSHGLALGDRILPLSMRTPRLQGERPFLWSLINFRGPTVAATTGKRTYVTYRFVDLLASAEQLRAGVEPEIPPSVFRDKIVLVGATASGLSDQYETPFSQGGMPGMQAHAAVLDDLLSNRFVRPAGRVAWVATVLALAVPIGLIAAAIPAWWSVAWALAGAAVLLATTTLAFANGYWLPVAQPAGALMLALVGGISEQYFVQSRDKRIVKQLFSRYVSPDVYRTLMKDPGLAKLGGERRYMTVLFSDIRGFTKTTEGTDPEQLVRTLNEYFTRMVEIVLDHRGTLDKFVGDQVMALFGAPLDDPDHAAHAVAAAIEMSREIDEMNVRWQAAGHPRLDVGIGISTGWMIAGNVGAAQVMSYTVIGDAVNVGARLEGLNKRHASRILISGETREALTQAFEVRFKADEVLPGKTTPTAIYEVCGIRAAANEGVS